VSSEVKAGLLDLVEFAVEHGWSARAVCALAELPTAVLGAIVIVAVAPLIAIGLAVAVYLWRELYVQVPSWTEHRTLHLCPRGLLFFASAPPIEETFGDLLAARPDTERLVLHCDGRGRIDLTGALALRSVREEAKLAGVAVELVEVPPHAQRILTRVLPLGAVG
jgi:SulP family sulfate permease